MSTKDDGRFVDSAVWKQLRETDDPVSLSEQQKAAITLTEVDLNDLLKCVESDSERERHAALGMLLQAVRGNNESLRALRDSLRDKATQLAKSWTIEEPPPPSDKEAVRRYVLAKFSGKRSTNVGFRSYALLAAVDGEAAAQFLVSHFAYETLSAHGKEEVLRQFAELCAGERPSKIALKRLIEVAEKGGPGAEKAVQYLIGRRLLERRAVEKITEKWRASVPTEYNPSAVAEFIAEHPRFSGQEETLRKHASDWERTKSVAALSRLYYDFFFNIPEGSSMEPLLGILGRPDWWAPHNPHVYNFSSEEGPALQIHLTTDGKLAGLRLK